MVSIIIPVYNAEKFIDETIESVTSQTYPNIEIICIDDGSTDGTTDILKNRQSKDQRIQVIHQNRQGVSAARNQGLDRVKGDYVFFLDADDLISIDCVANLLDIVQKINAIPCASICKFNKIQSPFFYKKSKVETDTLHVVSGEEYLKTILQKKRSAYIWGKLFPISVVSDTRFLTDLCYGEDLIFNSLILSKRDVSLIDVESATYFYRQHDSSITANFTIDTIRSNLKKIALLRSELDKDKYGYYISCLEISELWTLTKKSIITRKESISDIEIVLNEISFTYSLLPSIKLFHYIMMFFLSPNLLVLCFTTRLIMLKILPLRYIICRLIIKYVKII